MEHNEIKLNELQIYGGSDGLNYVEMLVPEGWTSTINVHKDSYGGQGRPYQFTVTHNSPDRTAALYFYSPLEYTDDHLRSFRDYETDDYGYLLRHFKDMQSVLDESVMRRFSKYDMHFIKHIPYTNNAKNAETRKQKALDRLNKNGDTFSNHYYYGGINIYGYTNNGHKRIRMCSCIIEALDYCRWNYLPNNIDFSFIGVDPTMVYPNCRYDQQNRCYIYTTLYQTDWSYRQHIEMDVLEKDYEYAYSNIFLPVTNKGVTICQDIWDDYRREAEILSKKERRSGKTRSERPRSKEKRTARAGNPAKNFMIRSAGRSRRPATSSTVPMRTANAVMTESWNSGQIRSEAIPASSTVTAMNTSSTPTMTMPSKRAMTISHPTVRSIISPTGKN